MQVFEKDAASWKTIGLAFTRAKGDLHKVDLTNYEHLRSAFQRFSVNGRLKSVIFKALRFKLSHEQILILYAELFF